MSKNFIAGKKEFTDGHTYVMGILNVTPDSFSDGGKYTDSDIAIKHVEEMIKDGADIIDVGGESTRPGYTELSVEEEISRVVPIIERIKNNFDTVISVDTYNSETADAALNAGADIINDIWGFKYDSNMAAVTAKHNASCILMHNKKEAKYNNFMADVLSELKESIKLAKNAGIPDEKICTDPGVGFAKDTEQNLIATKHVADLYSLGYPVLLGVSNKSMIGNTLGVPVDQRLYGTVATSVYAAIQKCMFVRVHNVKANYEAIKMTEAIINAK